MEQGLVERTTVPSNLPTTRRRRIQNCNGISTWRTSLYYTQVFLWRNGRHPWQALSLVYKKSRSVHARQYTLPTVDTKRHAESFFPHQFSCGTKGGAESAAHAVQAFLKDASDGAVLLKLDWTIPNPLDYSEPTVSGRMALP